MTFFGANNKVSNATVNNCKFDGIYITNSDGNTISDCTVTSNDRYGITIYDSDNTEIRNCIIQYNNYFGINLNASTYTIISDCNVSYNEGKGILLYSDSEFTTISDCEIEYNNHIGIDLSGTSNNDIINTKVSHNNGTGIDFGDVTTNQWIEDCNIIGNEGSGIDLMGASYVNIIGCNVSRNKGNGGIYSGNEVAYVNIINTEVWNNLAGDGIDFYGATWVNITYSNSIANSGNGVSFNSSTNHEYNTIKNCNIYENGKNGIFFDAKTSIKGDPISIQYNNIYLNQIYSNSENGIQFKTSYGSAYIQNNNIYSNAIHSNSQNGINFFSIDNIHIQDNLIYSNTIYLNNNNGIYFYAYGEDDDVSFIQNNCIYLNNIFSNNQHGIYLYAYDNAHIDSNDIYSNTIYLNYQNGVFLFSIGFEDIASICDNNIYNNTIFLNDQNGIFLNTSYSGSNSFAFVQGNKIYLNNISLNNYNGIYFNIYSPIDYIQDNHIYSNNIHKHGGGSGIYIIPNKPTPDWQSSYIYNNSIYSNLIGIRFVRIKSHIVNFNNISNNNNDGIFLYSSTYNTLRYNKITYNNKTGINLTSSSSDNKIENNNITSNNNNGILIGDNSNHNLITRNDISTNSEIGLNITDSSGNLIHHNNFKNNVQNAYDSTIALNDWDDGAEGNCWSDYAGSDDDGDGFGEDPYIVPGGGSRDWHPFMNYVDIAAPYITLTEPENGESNISVDSTISITFSKEMNTTTVESAISLSGGLMPTNFVWDAGNKKVTLTPSSDFSSETTYTVTITTDAKDLLGNRIEETYLFSFSSNDNKPPEISLSSPFDGEADVEASSDVVVSFNEPMQPSTISYSCIPNPGGWNIDWNSDNTIATFSHDNFGSEITYTFQITAGKDNSNLDLINGLVPNPWSFTTADFIPPVITSTSPSDKTSDVTITTEISITFSEKMNHQSVEDNIYTIFAYGIKWNGNTITLIPISELSYYTEYTVTIDSNAKDTADNVISSSNSSLLSPRKKEKSHQNLKITLPR
jgi:parallel beta-helix repeat protein